MLTNYFFMILISFCLGITFIFLFKRLALRYKSLILKGIPLVGGVSMGLSFILTCLLGFFLYSGLSPQASGIIIASSVILFFGIIDDIVNLSVMAKFLVQIIATSLLIFFGIKTQIVYIGNLVNIIITFIWVIGITNAFNHLDVMDGLAAGIAILAGLGLFIISVLKGDINSTIFTIALIGAIFSFLTHNFPPAKIYMGNSGSHFLGFILAAIALLISYAPLERKIALLSPILILGFPIFDTIFLVFMRIIQRRSAFKKSNDHLALRFIKIGYSKNKTLLFMLGLGSFFSLSGVCISQVSTYLGILVIILVGLVSLTLFKKMGKVVIDG